MALRKKAKRKKAVRRKAGRYRQVWQGHHITYEPEWIVQVTKGEHWIITQLQRLGSLSRGGVAAINYLLATKPSRDEPTRTNIGKQAIDIQ